MSLLDIAPLPEDVAGPRSADHRRRRRYQTSFRRVRSRTFWRLGFRQFSFRRITRVPQRIVPYVWTRPLVSWHALVPFAFRLQVSQQTQRYSSNLSPLRRGYVRAPRGAGGASAPRDSPFMLGVAHRRSIRGGPL